MSPRERVLPAATVARLPRYLEILTALAEDGHAIIASDELARRLGANAASVRKDLAALGPHGTRGVGYDVPALVARISDVLGVADERAVVIVGAGNLGSALASYDGFPRRGFVIAAVVDADPAKVGREVGGHRIEDARGLATLVAARGISVAVLAVPASRADEAARAVVDAGVRLLLNFGPAHLDVPAGVVVRSVDLSSELRLLSFLGGRLDVPSDDAPDAPDAAAG